LNLNIIWQSGFESFISIPAFIITSLFGLMLILANLYLWPLLVTVEQPWRGWFKNGLRLAVAHPFWGILVAAASLMPLAIGAFLPRIMFLTVSFAGSALFAYMGAWRIMKRYLNQADLQ